MKKSLLTLLIICTLSPLRAIEQWDYNVPVGTTLYLDVSQYWCCMESYLIYTYDGWYDVMSPVPGKHGLYQYTLTTAINNPDIRFMACATSVAPGPYSGWPGNLYTYRTDNGIPAWSPTGGNYAIITSQDKDNSKGKWASAPSPATSQDIALADVTTTAADADCVDKKFDLDITVTWTGVACKIGIESTMLPKKIVRNNIQSPYVYSIKGLNGTIGQQTIKVELLEADGTTVVDDTILTITPPDLAHCGTKHDKQVVCLNEQPITLTATVSGDSTNWSHDPNAKTQQVQVTLPVGTQQIMSKVYRPHLDATDNLMLNADFEQVLQYGQNPPGMESDYDYIPTFDPRDVYDTGGYGGRSGVYMISHNANYTWRNFLNIDPHGGNYFALFDATQAGDAWRAASSNNPNLQIIAGERYKFSCWAVNINNPNGGEDGHPAKLQFYIEYNGTKVKLGPLFSLKDQHEWVYYEAPLWTAPVSSTNVIISVMDEETQMGGGNDFGLDDIMFQRITAEKMMLAYTDTFDIQVLDCDQYYDTACVGDEYDKDGFHYQTLPTDGGKSIQVLRGEDVLNLYVVQPVVATLHAPQAICNFSGGTVNVPYTLSKGKPTYYTVEFSDPTLPSQSSTAWTTGSLKIEVPKAITDAQITATVTVWGEYGRCPQEMEVVLSFVTCQTLTATACQGEPYDDGRFHSTCQSAGVEKLVDGVDTLYLTVLEKMTATVSNTTKSICGDAKDVYLDITLNTATGKPATYEMTFSSVLITPIPSTAWPSQPVRIFVPTAAVGQDITSTLTMHDKDNICTAQQTFIIKVTTDDGLPIYAKWDNVLFVNNHEDQFVSYQWFRDNQPIDGANEQALYTGGDKMQQDGHEYYVVARKADGHSEQSCSYYFSDVQRSAPLNAGDIVLPVGKRIVYRVGPDMYVLETTYSDGSTSIEKVIER